jgi:predicted ArsR family transcriptional regulator
MVDIDAIPAEARWKILASASNDMSFAYRLAFMAATKGAYEEELNKALDALWREAGEKQAVVARAFRYPRDSARDVAETFSAISTLFLGPELLGRAEPVAGDRAVIITDRCPMASRAQKFGIEGKDICRHCRVYGTAAVESLNPGYTVRTTRGICMGDEACEMHIEPRA